MKSNHSYNINITLLIINFIFLFNFCDAIASETVEDQVKKLTLELRCMTCQNQSIHDSDAEF